MSYRFNKNLNWYSLAISILFLLTENLFIFFTGNTINLMGLYRNILLHAEYEGRLHSRFVRKFDIRASTTEFNASVNITEFDSAFEKFIDESDEEVETESEDGSLT